MDTDVQHSSKEGHTVVTVIGWAGVVVATLLTILLVVGTFSMISEWSRYEGGESTTALVITGFVAFVTALTWLLTWRVLAGRRDT
jgi:hypothetical protein